MSYRVVVLPSARSDFVELAKRDREVARAALSLASELRENPWLGDRMRSRLGLAELHECRRLRFDRAGWKGKPRYRLIYRNEPSDGAPHIVAILAAAEREGLSAYRRAKPRLIERLRALGEQKTEVARSIAEKMLAPNVGPTPSIFVHHVCSYRPGLTPPVAWLPSGC